MATIVNGYMKIVEQIFRYFLHIQKNGCEAVPNVIDSQQLYNLKSNDQTEQAFSPSTWEAEMGDLGIRGQLGLPRRIQDIQGYPVSKSQKSQQLIS